MFTWNRPGKLASIILALLAGYSSLEQAPAEETRQGSPSERLTPLSRAPDWNRLDVFQHTITRDSFSHLLNAIYAPRNAAGGFIELANDHATIQAGGGRVFVLHFAPDSRAEKQVPRYWKPLKEISKEEPLKGFTIAIDPGHLGGTWARMEERWFQIGTIPPVKEGDLTLEVARALAPKLRRLGANVVLVRSRPGPLTKLRPEDLSDEARSSLLDRGITNPKKAFDGPNDPDKEHSIDWEAQRLFYRVAEIHRRAQIVNRRLQPDLTLCLHLNAEPWGNPSHPSLVDTNHLHLIVNGTYTADELSYEDVRFAMLLKMLSRDSDEEIAVSDTIAQTLAAKTGLDPFHYTGANATAVGQSGYVWARDLLANRVYRCPVIYIECYVMNSRAFFARFQAGDYSGLRNFEGAMRENIFQEYSDGIAEGLRKAAAADPAASAGDGNN